MHLLHCTVTPHNQIAEINLTHKNGQSSFCIDGKSTHPSSGNLMDTKRKKIMANLIESAKLLEIQFLRAVKKNLWEPGKRV